jgi:anti-anti-sigma factor
MPPFLAGMVADASPLAVAVCLESVVSTSTSLDLSVIPDRAIVRVKPRGEIDLANRDALDAQLQELWESGWQHVVLDLRDVTFLDSSGLHVLLTHHRSAVESQRRLTIADGSPAVSHVLALTGLDRVLDCTATRSPKRS